MNNKVDHLLLFEFIYVEASDILDEKGRPLGESRASDPIKKTTTFEKRQCPYRDSRYMHEKPMNVSPLKFMTKSWMKILEEVAVVRHRYQARYGVSDIKLNDIWFLSGIGLYYPYFQLYKKEDPKQDGEISIVVSSYYKVAIGMFQQFIRLFIGLVQEGHNIADFKADTQFIYDYVDKNNLLVGRAEVCSGPINLIKQIVEEMLGNTLLKKQDAEMEKLLSEEDYQNLIRFVAQLLVVDVVNRVYKDVEGDWYLRLTQLLHENSQSDNPIPVMEQLYEQLKGRRRQDPSAQSIRMDVFYQQVQALVAQLAKGEEVFEDRLQSIIDEKVPTDSGLKKQVMNRCIAQAQTTGNPLSQSQMLVLYQFVEMAMEYMEREKAMLEVVTQAEANLWECLGHENPQREAKRKHLLDYNNYYFADAFEQVFGLLESAPTPDLHQA